MSAEARACPTLVLLAGPNGAGKSTLYETRIAPTLKVPFINADHIQRTELKDKRTEAAYEAARLATERRDTHLKDLTSFATETVFSHPSKLELVKDAKARGYRVFLFHVGIESAALAVARVEARVGEGGHPVPEKKIRERFVRNQALIREAAFLSDLAHIFDNSALNVPPERMLTITDGRVTYVAPNLPDWVLDLYGDDLLGL